MINASNARITILTLFLKKTLNTDFQYEYLGAVIFSESELELSYLANNSFSDKPKLLISNNSLSIITPFLSMRMKF